MHLLSSGRYENAHSRLIICMILFIIVGIKSCYCCVLADAFCLFYYARKQFCRRIVSLSRLWSKRLALDHTEHAVSTSNITLTANLVGIFALAATCYLFVGNQPNAVSYGSNADACPPSRV